jgi:hypothetical protein
MAEAKKAWMKPRVAALGRISFPDQFARSGRLTVDGRMEFTEESADENQRRGHARQAR